MDTIFKNNSSVTQFEAPKKSTHKHLQKVITYCLYICICLSSLQTLYAQDTDGDNVEDTIDLDDDNDGILDTVECVNEAQGLVRYDNYSGQDIFPNEYDIIMTLGGGPIGSISTNALPLRILENISNYSFTFSEPVTSFIFHFGSLNDKSELGNFTITTASGAVITNADFVISHAATDDTYNLLAEETTNSEYGIRAVKSTGAPFSSGTFYVDVPGDGQGWGILKFENYDTDPIASISFEIHTGTSVVQFGIEAQSTCFADFDGDGIINRLDVDSDNDGIPDNIEAQPTKTYIAPNADTNATYSANSGVNSAYVASPITPVDTDGTDFPDYLDLDADDDDVFDIVESGSGLTDADTDGYTDGAVGVNGLDNTIDSGGADDYGDSNGSFDNTQIDNFPDTDGDIQLLSGDVDYRDAPYPVMMTQLYSNGYDKIIELTNVSTKTIEANSIHLAMYADTTGDQTDVMPTAVYTVAASIAPGQSVVVGPPGSIPSANINATAIREYNFYIVNFEDGNDIVILTLATDTDAWKARYDCFENIGNKTSYVRSDNVSEGKFNFINTDWVAFVDDDLDPYRSAGLGGPERHPHDPLLSEVDTATGDKNMGLGYHRTGYTLRAANAWSNGIPDRSRTVYIQEDYSIPDAVLNETTFSAQTLIIENSSTLAITDAPMIVSEAITLDAPDDEIRLIGTSQLISTHTGTTLVNGLGNLYVDQNSEVESLYCYNYFGSPVNSTGASTYTVADVFKDGSTPTSATSTAVDINFISGFDGAATTPISIAEHWIYSFGTLASDWTQILSTGTIPQTDGVIFKGPGQAQNYTFVGTPKDGTMQTAVGPSRDYLLGNPYASSISIQRFIEDNLTSTTGAVYFWEQKTSIYGGTDINSHNFDGYVGGYAIRNIAMGLAANNPLNTANQNNGIAGVGDGVYREPGTYIPIGQGFFVEGSATGGTIEFNNSQREFVLEGADAIFYRSATENVALEENTNTPSLPIIKLGMEYVNDDNLDLHMQIGVSFLNGNSFAFDAGYDARMLEAPTTGFYWNFSGNNTQYAIAGVQEIADDLQVPLTIEMGYTGSIRIRIDEWANVNRDVYLIDTAESNHYLLSNAPAEIFMNAGTHAGRFFLVFSLSETLSTNEVAALQFHVYAEEATQDIMIVNTQQVHIDQVQLFDVLGKEIQTWNDIARIQENGKIRLKTGTLAKGIYILKVKSSQGIAEKKIHLGFQ